MFSGPILRDHRHPGSCTIVAPYLVREGLGDDPPGTRGNIGFRLMIEVYKTAQSTPLRRGTIGEWITLADDPTAARAIGKLAELNIEGSPKEKSMRTRLESAISARFGVLPNFFRLTTDDPEITENLWGFAQFAYLDNPLPSLLKERLFVYLSLFCDVRYCIARHLGFLVGLGRPAGDPQCLPQSVDEVLPLLRRDLPFKFDLDQHLALCEGSGMGSFPPSRTARRKGQSLHAQHMSS